MGSFGGSSPSMEMECAKCLWRRRREFAHVSQGKGLVCYPCQSPSCFHSLGKCRGHIHCGRHPKVQPFLRTMNNQPDSFVEDYNKIPHLQLQYTEEDANRNLHAYITSLLGSLRCRTDVKLADGKGMLLKYMSSYVTKMHEVATSEDLYCCDVSEFQAAHSFLRTVHLLEPEIIFQLSNIRVCWANKLTKQLRPLFPEGNFMYQLYLRRPATEKVPLLIWLCNHSMNGNKSKPLEQDKYLVVVKFVSIFNHIFFFQHLLVHHPHCNPQELHHSEDVWKPWSYTKDKFLIWLLKLFTVL